MVDRLKLYTGSSPVIHTNLKTLAMTTAELKKGQTLIDEIKEHQSVLDYLNKFKSGVDDPIEFVVNYLKECRNVGSSGLRKSLALGFLEDSKTFLTTSIKMKQEEFEKLSAIGKSAKSINSKTLLAFLEASSLQKYADIPELPLEIAIVECCTNT